MKRHLVGNFVTDKIFISPPVFSNFQWNSIRCAMCALRSYTHFNGRMLSYNLHPHLMAARHNPYPAHVYVLALALHSDMLFWAVRPIPYPPCSQHTSKHIESGDIVIIIVKLLANYGHKYHYLSVKLDYRINTTPDSNEGWWVWQSPEMFNSTTRFSFASCFVLLNFVFFYRNDFSTWKIPLYNSFELKIHTKSGGLMQRMST